MAQETVIVTLLDSDGRDLGDYELSARLSVGKLYPALEEALAQTAPRLRRCNLALCLSDEGRPRPIDARATLWDSGVRDGSYLRLAPGGPGA